MTLKEKEIFQTFKLPIEYCNDKIPIQPNLLEDLELIETKDPSEQTVYSCLFKSTSTLGKKCVKQWSKYFTTDLNFLKESQKIYQSMTDLKINKQITEQTFKDWNEIKNTEDFLEKYQYVEWERIKGINRYSLFLTFMSYYNLSAPLFNLALPIIILILPFFVLRISGIPLTFATYWNVVTIQLKSHIIGKMYYNFWNIDWNQRIYYIVSLGLFFYNIYQNVLSCWRFYMNTYKISNYFLTLQNYLKYTIDQMNYFDSKTNRFKTYLQFCKKTKSCKNKLIEFYEEVKHIHGKILSLKKITQIGFVMKQFFILYDDEELEEAFLYSFGFNSYIDTIHGLCQNIHKKTISKTKFSNSKIPIVDFQQFSSPSLIDKNPVKNNIDLSQNIIITGPNAAGKTTLVKSTILNILFSQQVGFGFFSTGTITPFHFLHAYINIPDTVGRDSLFQSEARRCKEILDSIDNNGNKKHFCIFDELYSGTNPYEATSSAYSFLRYLNKYDNVKLILTTHYVKICELFQNNKFIQNYNMETYIHNEIPKYSYKLKKGISNIKGGICILKQLRYPKKILKYTKKILRTL